jgi:hypothetical protein
LQRPDGASGPGAGHGEDAVVVGGERRLHADGPHYFGDLAGTSEAEEQAAIDAGQIRAGGIRSVASRP